MPSNQSQSMSEPLTAPRPTKAECMAAFWADIAVIWDTLPLAVQQEYADKYPLEKQKPAVGA